MFFHKCYILVSTVSSIVILFVILLGFFLPSNCLSFYIFSYSSSPCNYLEFVFPSIGNASLYFSCILRFRIIISVIHPSRHWVCRSLPNQGLVGPIPKEIGNLEYLTILDLSNSGKTNASVNQISGDLSALQGLINLQNL